MRRLKLIATVMLLAILSPHSVRAADVSIVPTGPVFKISGIAWGSGANAFNNNFFFTPLNQNESVCIYVKNNNTSNTHPFTAAVVVTYDPQETTPSDGTWTSSANASGNAGAAPSVAFGIGVNVSGVAQVSLNFSGSTTLGGSPDTANLTIIQTTGTCSGGTNINLSLIPQVSAVTALQAFADGLGSAYIVGQGSAGIVNPAASSVPLHVFLPATSNRQVYFDHITISCSAACTIKISNTSSLGTTCTTITPNFLKSAGVATPQTTGNTACTTIPVLSGNFYGDYLIPAGVATTIDLRGIILVPGGGIGLAMDMQASLTGTLWAQFFYYEK